MACLEQIQLSDYIKTTHENLRINSKLLGFDMAWRLHCENVDLLQKYAITMQKLATKYWESNAKSSKSLAKSRIEWIYDFSITYFMKDGLLNQRNRECVVAAKMHVNLDLPALNSSQKLTLLDVGSCYNAFKVYDCFDVVPLDIAPATNDVYQCDFMKLNIVDECTGCIDTSQIFELQRCTFDIIVFSLFLEYLPSSKHRLICCRNAYQLLKPEGLLFIVTPDSKHVGANAKIMKSWRYQLAKLGFSRIKYEKLPYIHCMVFRKSLKLDIANRWADLHSDQMFFDSLVIPQDLNRSVIQNFHNDKHDQELCISLFNELPTV